MENVNSISYKGGSTAVTQSDSADDPAGPFAGFYVGSVSGGAAVSFVDLVGNESTWPTVLAGVIYNVPIKRIRVTGTTASSIFGVKG